MTAKQLTLRSDGKPDDNAAIYLVGGGIASLAAAAFLIRDGDIPGRNITILEESEKIGGSLDAASTPEAGYIMRGGRMIESKYLCTYDLFSSIPTLDDSKTVTQEIVQWNETSLCAARKAIAPRSFRNTGRISPASDNFANSRTTWCLRWSTRFARRKRPCIRCLDRAGHHRRFTKATTIHASF